ncbi:glycerophosphodiester phosphodiesterase [Alkalilimnicola sp. S0819]|uniref:glycerophosphodiester phosphodiesterase n=1 Tax=Alkalilimnicola sp. S0819 TaxID=2613922 RepID=UPI001869AB82|nr:glycerophosphodiester phosphodiesterase [Alkalilimnicola sp. S0819]
MARERLWLVGHRGAHGRIAEGLAVENTLDAFELCLRNGIWGIELDIRLTGDGEPVVHHDPRCGRLFRRPDLIIAETGLEPLRRAIPAIPHLDEVVGRYAGRLHLMLEIKDSWRQRPSVVARIQKSLAALEPCRDFHLLSLVPDHLSGFSAITPRAFIDVALTNTRDIIRKNLQLGHGGVAGSFALLDGRLVRELKAHERQIGTGQVELAAIARREINRGIEWIFSDKVLQLQRRLRPIRTD